MCRESNVEILAMNGKGIINLTDVSKIFEYSLSNAPIELIVVML